MGPLFKFGKTRHKNTPAGGSSGIRRRSPHVREHNFATRIEALFREGRYSAATTVLDLAHKELSNTALGPNETPRPDLERTKEILLALNPPRNEEDLFPLDDPPVGSQDTLPEPIEFVPQSVQICIRRLPKGSSNGPSGWTYNIIRRLYGDLGPGVGPHLTSLSKFLSSLANGKHPHHLWTRSRAVLLPKPEAGKFRPLGIGETWYRVLGRCLLRDIGESPGANLQPLQLGGGVSGGCEIAARMAQALWDAHPNNVIVKTDFKNAFNLVPRGLIYKGLEAHCPELIPWFRWAYGNPSDLLDSQGEKVGSNEKGCRQGDPLAPLLFCVAIQDTLKDVSALLAREHAQAVGSGLFPGLENEVPGQVMAYMDDCSISVPYRLVDAIAPQLAGIFSQAGLILNESKCRIVGRRAGDIAGEPVFKVVPEGDIILGNPTGTDDYRQAECTRMVDEKVACLDTLRRLQVEPSTSLNLVRYCINPRMGYLARVQELGDRALKKFDCRVDIAVCHIAGHNPLPPGLPDPPPGASPPPSQPRDIEITASLRSLPLHQGGLGIARHSGIAGQLGRLQSRELLQSFSKKFFADDIRLAHTHSALSRLVIGEANPSQDDFADTGQVDLRTRAEAAYSKDADALQARLIAQRRTAHAAWLLSSRFEGSGRWISPPIGLYTSPETTVLGSDYLHALRSRLLLHPLEEMLTACPHRRLHCRSLHSLVPPPPGAQVTTTAPVEEGPPAMTNPGHHARLLEPFHFLDCTFNKGLTKARHDCVGKILEKFLDKEFSTNLSYTTEKPVPSQDKVLISRLEARTRYGSPEDESSDEDQDDEELIPSPKE
eukprot:gene11798-13280_t